MTFESVRLTHAQAVANHYITNQIYIPTDEDHKSRGSFLILLDSIGAKDGTFIASLVNTLIREYYRSSDTDRLAVFEQALVRVNNLLKAPGNDAEGHNLDGCIVLVAHDEIHLTYIGTCHAFLHRQKNLLHLVDPSLDDAPTGGFSVITSGEIQENDVLVMGTPESTAAQFESDITFSLTHDPLFEAGRSLARLFKQHHQHGSEAQFIRFTEGEELHEQIYCDRPLESSGEKMDQIQKQVKHHTELIVNGIHFLSQKALGLTKKNAPAAASLPAVHEPTYEEFMEDDADIDNNTVTKLEELNEEAPAMMAEAPSEIADEIAATTDTPDDTDEPLGEYAVKHYWESGTTTVADDAPTPADTTSDAPEQEPQIQPRKPVISYDDGDTEELDPIPLTTPRRGFKVSMPALNFSGVFANKWWLNRYVYISLALIVIVILGVRMAGSMRTQSNTPTQSTTERDSLISLAETELRDSESSEIQDNTTDAITHLMAAQTALAKITDENRNEQTKSLTKQTTDNLNRLTSTIALKAQSTADLADAASKVVATAHGTYAFLANNSLVQIKDTTATEVTKLPVDTSVIDAVSYDSLQRMAYALKAGDTTNVYTVTASSNQVQEMSRTDSKAWPDTKTLGSFSTNLYFVGPTMFKASRSSDTAYRIASYANGASTASIKSIVTNGGIFYALANDRELLRIAANSPITPVSLSGVPDVFLPQSFTQILTSQSEATLAFFDAEGQRLLIYSTDGSYRKQYKLPENTKANICDLNEKILVCATADKKLVTFSL